MFDKKSVEICSGLSADYWINESIKDEQFDDLFEVENEIASGPYGTVLKCHPKGNPGHKLTAKVLKKNKNKKVVQREVSLLLKLKHPNVCRFMEVIESLEEIFLIHEYCAGGEVLDRVAKKTKYNERVASRILRQILEGLQYIHQEELVHGNLKPENFLFESKDREDCLIKITDIELNMILDKELLRSSLNLCPQYCAPETLRNQTGNPSSDMWSIGAFTYTLLTGEEPFKCSSQEELYTKILKGEYDTESANYKRLSINAKDFIIKLLCEDPKKRLTVSQALKNQWLLGKASSLKNLPLDSIQALVSSKNSQARTKRVEKSMVKYTGRPSLLQKYLVWDAWIWMRKKTRYGSTLMDCVKSAVENPDSSVGLYAPDPDCYDEFKEIFWPVISDYHRVEMSTLKHQHDFGNPDLLPDLDSKYAESILSTRIRMARSVFGFPMGPKLLPETRHQLKDHIVESFENFTDDFAGDYLDLAAMSKEDKLDLIENHYLFADADDKYLESAGGYLDWPNARGIFMNKMRTFSVWVNEEDHVRIISIQMGSNVKQVYKLLVQGARLMQKSLAFVQHEKLGFLTFCPTNIGTGLRASVHVKLPKLAESGKLGEMCNKLGLQPRGVHGEHSESVGGVYDISNKVRIGKSEFELVNSMCTGIKVLLEAEFKLPDPSPA